MTPVKPRISKFRAYKILPSGLYSVKVALYTHERLLSESSRPYMVEHYLSAFNDCAYFLVSCHEEKTYAYML
jgi:hypothetical protein